MDSKEWNFSEKNVRQFVSQLGGGSRRHDRASSSFFRQSAYPCPASTAQPGNSYYLLYIYPTKVFLYRTLIFCS